MAGTDRHILRIDCVTLYVAVARSMMPTRRQPPLLPTKVSVTLRLPMKKQD
ncbi:hypothetical protein OK016_26170 [Vibrio chagasii]|nr:hypothetical protein [Vibrio chagasii]